MNVLRRSLTFDAGVQKLSIGASDLIRNRVNGYDKEGADEEKYFRCVVIGRAILRFSSVGRKPYFCFVD